MSKILIISSGIHKDLASEQLELCTTLVKNAGYAYQVELLQAGTYEIPFVINTYHQKNPFDGYIALGLILKANLDHYNNIMSHIRYCFTQFALNDIIVGNGIITGASIEELSENIRSANPCHSAYPSAVNAVDCLIKLKNKIA
ncbi:MULTISPECIES: 6,7-dimethyl-8-ribityllumazine synthase [unclassified Legionella]|uniref:6,7-dimethyl-8-ribityllumazine synthase n=1 Tax=Legionella sp. PC997 TaxID=2755562 RepID=UPI0015F9C079|nr:6,7-dimethyl-8-ribityllumazine synthase [Legionella sp. PC997]QMT59085.1 6,7-dimethyl-8-ribityllumazine synthase [Legionella sp. PC997]